LTRNAQASRYRLSDYEQALAAELAGQPDKAAAHLAGFLAEHPRSFAAWEAAAEAAIRRGEIDRAGAAYEKAVEFSPTNWHLHFRLAMFYRTRFGLSGDPRYKERALEAMQRALRYGPYVDKVRQAYDELEADRFGYHQG
jgi:predicted Zn-dependent protease